MAKKKKTTKKKKVVEPVERSPFWALSGAVLLVVLASFLLLGGFGTGGALPVGMFKASYWLFGYAAYLTPVALAYWGVHKFIAEDHRIPLPRLFGMISVLLFSSGFFYVLLASRDGNGTWSDGHGGVIGKGIGSMVLTALDRIPAVVLFAVLTFLAFCFVFGVSVKSISRLGELFKKNKDKDPENELASLKAKASETGFEMKEGVPIVKHGGKDEKPAPPAPKAMSLKNTAQKLTDAENHMALTTTSDPDWRFPNIDLLGDKQDKADPGDVKAKARLIQDTLQNFNIDVEMEGADIGPRVTQYRLKPPTGVKLTKITALENNLALDLAATNIRMEAPIPGKRAVGIEVPNEKAATVRLRSILTSTPWQKASSPLEFAIGKDIAGEPVVADLAKMPHLLVAGQTGSGKSVMINTILTSLLYRNSPSDLKLILVDPKQVELKLYEDIPHLLTPVITEPEKCISALKWAVAEMERRLKTMSKVGKRDINGYNNLKNEEGMPHIVIVIDELSDLMMMAARDVEALIVRIAQKARATGIHLVLATQRPSVDVITGLIKANVPGRIAFTTQSQVDSRTIIDGVGAEKLLGRGDMLLSTSDMPKPKRVQAAFIGDDETAKVTGFIREQRPATYDEEVVSQPVQFNGKGGIVADHGGGGGDADDALFKDAVGVVIENRKASTSLLQRRLRIGYGRAARLIEQMEDQGIISQADGSRAREVLVTSMDDVFGGGSGSDDEVLDENFPD